MKQLIVRSLLIFSCWVGLPIFAAGQTSIPKVLYISHAALFAHESRYHAGDVLKALGQSSGAFTVTATDHLSTLTTANLASYDALAFFTSGELPITDAQKAAILQFVSSGKAFIGLHGAADTFYNWPEYGVMLGGYFENHPWTEDITIAVDDQTHRSTKHLGPSFSIFAETYQFKSWSRANVHVLLSLDMTSVNPAEGSRTDGDYALAWTKTYGQGRVFYTALGHETAMWDDPRFQQHVLGGIRWALADRDLDADDDTLPDEWEIAFGLDRHSGDGANGPAGDPDGDGVTNLQELAARTSPVGTFKRYLAEGATGTFFDTRIALVNPDPTVTAHAQLRFLTEDGPLYTWEVVMPPHSRQTVFVDDIPGMASAAFSTVLDSDAPIVVDRTMTWGEGQGYGSHAETAVVAPAPTWYFAEGATHGSFALFYLIQNPSTTDVAHVTGSYFTSTGQQIDRKYDVQPNRRLTIPVDDIPELQEAEMAATFSSSTVPIIVERAMYLSNPGQPFAGGHDSAGATALASRWFLAEGATGSFFNTFVLVGNPNGVAAPVTMRYLPAVGAPVERNHDVPAHGRLTVNIATESATLASADVSTVVTSPDDLPVVVERAMWWPAPPFYEGHGSMGTTQTGTSWALADGEAGGANKAKTFLLVATGDAPAVDSLRLTVFVEGGETLQKVYPNVLTPNRRFTFDLDSEFPAVNGHRFGMQVDSLGETRNGDVVTPVTRMPLVVERAMYSDAGGVVWAAGSNVVATKLQ